MSDQPFLRPDQINALPSRQADCRSAYGSDPLQFGDLRLPDGSGPHPVAVVIHGGCWITAFADLQNTAALADALRDCGVATWNIEYRRADYPGGGWPGTFFDVAHATDHLRNLAAEYPLDLSRIVAMGHSAGGHLALWAAGRHNLKPDSPIWTPDPLPIKGVVVLGGPGDLARFAVYAPSVCDSQVVGLLMGGLPHTVPDRYREASPIERLPVGVQQIFITGEHDWVVPPEFGDAYTAAAKAAGDQAEHVLVRGAGHHEYNAPQSVAWPAVLSAVTTLLA